MRELELTNSPVDHGLVLTTMLFPNDSTLREQFFEVNLATHRIQGMADDIKIEFDAQTIEILINAPSRKELTQKAAEAIKRAIYAGDILATIYLMDRFKAADPAFNRPSMNKAIEFTKQFGLQNRFGDGEKMYYSEKKVRDCWEEFKTVAHFWAAHRISQSYNINKGENFESLETLRKFLAVAKRLFEFGTSFIPKGARPQIPILSEKSAWIIPNGIMPLELVSDRVPDQLLKYAKAYKTKS